MARASRLFAVFGNFIPHTLCLITPTGQETISINAIAALPLINPHAPHASDRN